MLSLKFTLVKVTEHGPRQIIITTIKVQKIAGVTRRRVGQYPCHFHILRLTGNVSKQIYFEPYDKNDLL